MNEETKAIRTYLWMYQVTKNKSWAYSAIRLNEKLTEFIAMEWGLLFTLPIRMDRLKELSYKNVVRLKWLLQLKKR